MSKGHDLIRNIIKDGGHSGIRLVRPELFVDEEIKAYELLINYYKNTGGELPPFEYFERQNINLNLPQGVPETSFIYNYNYLVERYRYNSLRTLHESLKDSDIVQNRNLEKAEKLTTKFISDYHRFDIDRTDYEAADLMESVLYDYEQTEEISRNGGQVGIESGWEPLDRLVSGYWPGDLIVLAGRRGRGKSYLLAKQVLNAVIKRNRVVFVTMEMTAKDMARRLAAIQLRLDPIRIKKARLLPQEKERFVTTVENFNQYPLKIIECRLSKKVSDIIPQIKEFRPDIVFIDGSYFLKPNNSNIKVWWEQQASVHESLKIELALGCNIPVVCTVQQNRASRTNKDGDGIVAGSDVIEQLASVLMSVSLISDNSHRRKINIVKNRDGPEGVFVINYIFSELNFDVDEDLTREENEKINRSQQRQQQRNHMDAQTQRML